MKNLNKLLIIAFAFTGILANAQNNVIPCYADEMQQAYFDANPQAKIAHDQTLQELRAYQNNSNVSNKKAAGDTIPVVFHIIYDSPNSNISKAQILDGLRVLNEDYNGMNADTSLVRPIFKSRIADVGVTFVLATKDPLGNCTEGITRTFSSLTNDADNSVKNVVGWNNDKYLNIWVVNSIDAGGLTGGIILGYANFPSPGQSAFFDGIVMRHDRLGEIGTSVSDGRTLSHEVGHYLGLPHTFQGGCGNDPNTDGDGIHDTPPVASSTSGCPLSRNSCSNDSPDEPDQIENHMDYSSCSHMFTNGQKNVMQFYLHHATTRGQLTNSANLRATGVAPGSQLSNCAPVADMNLEQDLICVGGNVTYSETSYNGTPTTWAWNFPGGTPSTSGSPNPNIVYNTPGIYDATVTVSNAAGSDSKTISQRVIVRPNTPLYWNSFSEGFESITVPNTYWSVLNPQQNRQWAVTNRAAYTGNQCVWFNNFNSGSGNVDELITPGINIQGLASAEIKFWYAYAERADENSDNLRIYVSIDCGQTWTLRRTLAATLLESVPNKVTPFTPQSQSEWREGIVNVSAFIPQGDNLLVKFQFNSGGGNNLYIDDINITGAIGLNEITTEALDLKVMPNPANQSAVINFNIETPQEISIKVVDMLGREIKAVDTKAYEAGEHNLPLSLPAGTKKGLYFLVFETQGKQLHQKFIYTNN